MAEALREGEEVLVEHVLAGGGKGGEGAAVKGVAQGQDGAAAGAVLVVAVFAGQLEKPLVGLRARVAEEGRRHARPGAEAPASRA